VISTAAILSYHKIGNPPRDGWHTWNYTGVEEFSSQLEWFHRRGWEFLSARDFLNASSGSVELPEKSVLVTFDDAYESLLANALPVLRKFSAPGVVFVPTQFVGETNLFDHGVEPVERIAGWDTLAAMESAGISVESHGSTHRAFSSLNDLEIEQELALSKRAIRENLGKDSRLFAFPYGDGGTDKAAVDSAVRRAGYDVAFLYGGGSFELKTNPPLCLPRLAMGPGVNLDEMLGTTARV
jgi:peptidoglycan/xylan/chitin deacetylase (PgdA/CDA1 family)